ncbi:MAG: hypothetical protein JST30_15330 [Armatimonadetes bacterium]|nr:hypothetical protein [Armatimonadota bacterium]
MICVAGSATARADIGRLLPSVSRQLERAEACLESGRHAEAQAYADLTLLSRDIGVSVTGDVNGIAWSALEDWEQALGGQVRFVPASLSRADLTISFRPTVAMAGRDVVGTATCTRGVREWTGGVFTYRATGSVEVALCSPLGTTLSPASLKQATMHEVGHFLGLDDTSKVGSLMGPIDFAKTVAGPTSSELTVLVDMRAQANVIRDRAVMALTLSSGALR